MCRLKNVLVTALGFGLLSACSTFSAQATRVASVKTAAVIGFGGDVNLESKSNGNKPGGLLGGVANTINAVNTLKQLSAGELEAAREMRSEATYTLLVEKLGQTLSWQILDRTAVAANSDYQHAAAEKRSQRTLFVSGIAADDVAERLEATERAALIKALGVDAIIIARISFRIGDSSGIKIGGVGSTTTYPEAVVQLKAYDSGGKEPIWEDSWAEGQPASIGVAETLGVDDHRKLTEALVEAAQRGYDELLARYHANTKITTAQ